MKIPKKPAAGYEGLAVAIIEQAIKDYRKAKTWQKRKAIANFFLSEWFEVLTDADGREILKRLEKEVEKKKGVEQNGYNDTEF